MPGGKMDSDSMDTNLQHEAKVLSVVKGGVAACYVCHAKMERRKIYLRWRAAF